jgi:hypothetical protein
MRDQILWLAAASMLCLPSAQAQNNSPQTNAMRAPNRPKLPYKRNVEEFKRDILTKAPDLPDLPQYSGNAKFTNGTVSPHAKGGNAFSLVYNCNDTPQSIIDWYSRTLSQYKWNISSTRPGVSINATKGNNYVSVQIGTRSTPNSKCDMFVLYRQNPQGK